VTVDGLPGAAAVGDAGRQEVMTPPDAIARAAFRKLRRLTRLSNDKPPPLSGESIPNGIVVLRFTRMP
jgi:hypothetical protein